MQFRGIIKAKSKQSAAARSFSPGIFIKRNRVSVFRDLHSFQVYYITSPSFRVRLRVRVRVKVRVKVRIRVTVRVRLGLHLGLGLGLG